MYEEKNKLFLLFTIRNRENIVSRFKHGFKYIFLKLEIFSIKYIQKIYL